MTPEEIQTIVLVSLIVFVIYLLVGWFIYEEITYKVSDRLAGILFWPLFLLAAIWVSLFKSLKEIIKNVKES